MWLVFYSMVWAGSTAPGASIHAMPWGQVWMGKANCEVLAANLNLQRGRCTRNKSSIARCLPFPLFNKP